MARSTARAIRSRPLDLLILCFLLAHIPITFLFDSQIVLPREWVRAAFPGVLQRTLANYVRASNDPLVRESPVCFRSASCLRAASWQTPVSSRPLASSTAPTQPRVSCLSCPSSSLQPTRSRLQHNSCSPLQFTQSGSSFPWPFWLPCSLGLSRRQSRPANHCPSSRVPAIWPCFLSLSCTSPSPSFLLPSSCFPSTPRPSFQIGSKRALASIFATRTIT
ncbi:hypothetical protein BC830DRAFT_152500 [Chytriomyces sp. MP71]|nr:hypothetical protein BC830DRAFT_152500 [Chytriomyces sp. MP71]